MLFKSDKEAVHGCSENAHFHDPGSGDDAHPRPLAPLAIVGRGESHPITLADWSAPSAAGSSTLLLVCRGVHFHRQRNASAHRRADLPGKIGALSMGAQSNVY